MTEAGKIVAVASSKGGVGKSSFTAAIASALAKHGLNVGILDNDPNQPIIDWLTDTAIPGIKAYPQVSDTEVFDTLDRLREEHDIVLADMEGSANLGVAMAIASADLVIVPSQGSGLDDKESGKTLSLIHSQSKLQRREIPYRVLFTRTSAAITPRSLKRAYKRLRDRKIPFMKHEFYNLDAFKIFMEDGVSIYELTKEQVAKPERAVETLHTLVAELLAVLKDPKHGIDDDSSNDTQTGSDAKELKEA